MTITDTRTSTLGGRLRAGRLFAGIEQNELAEALGVSRQTISNWENGNATLSATAMIKWSEMTKVSLDWIAWGSKKAPSKDGAEGVRPEGFEPPAYWSVAAALNLVLAFAVVRISLTAKSRTGEAAI